MDFALLLGLTKPAPVRTEFLPSVLWRNEHRRRAKHIVDQLSRTEWLTTTQLMQGEPGNTHRCNVLKTLHKLRAAGIIESQIHWRSEIQWRLIRKEMDK